MGRKFYFEQEDKGIIFRTNRCIGDVRIPNYVYDIWMPVIGSDAIGVYGVYCRLEMNGSVKKISQRTLASACRIGTEKLNRINSLLQECGFIDIDKPTGYKRLMHFTTEITVNDPPQEVSSEIIAKHCTDFEPLTPWLTIAETPNSVSGDAKQRLDVTPNGAANIASLGLHPLEFEPDAQGAIPPLQEQKPNEDIETFFAGAVPEEPATKAKPTPEKKDAFLDIVQQAGRRASPIVSWLLPGVYCGDHAYLEPYKAFCAVIQREPVTVGEKKTCQWLAELERIAQNDGGYTIPPGVMAQAIKAIRGDWNFEHKRWRTPYHSGFAELVELTAAQLSMGTGAQSNGWSTSL